MRVLRFAPLPELAPFVRSITVVETDVEATRILLPETGLILGLRYRGYARELAPGAGEDGRLPDATLAGLRRSARRMLTSAGGGTVLVTFRELGAAAFFRHPLHECFGATLPLAELVPRDALDEAQEELLAEADPVRRSLVVQRFLLRRRRREAEADRVVAGALRALTARHGAVRTGELAAALGISRDRLEKRFRQVVGTSPKQYGSLLRLKRAVALQREGLGLSELAIAAGYYDQAHFTRDFRSFVGRPPREFFERAEYC